MAAALESTKSSKNKTLRLLSLAPWGPLRLSSPNPKAMGWELRDVPSSEAPWKEKGEM